jgi:UPF0042 nucleotide-binding protein
MLPDLVFRLQTDHPQLAVSIDARDVPDDAQILKNVISELRQPEWHCEIIYLDADNHNLLRRFSETRRRHPLTNSTVSLQEAINRESTLLRPLASMADVIIDTTHLTQHQLCVLIRDKVDQKKSLGLQLLIQSFGFKNSIPADADFVFDVRCLPNPYWVPELRNLTGKDKAVADYLNNAPTVREMIEDIIKFLNTWIPRFEADNRSYLTVGIGCTGGQHRSVYIAEQLIYLATQRKLNVQIRHRDLN